MEYNLYNGYNSTGTLYAYLTRTKHFVIHRENVYKWKELHVSTRYYLHAPSPKRNLFSQHVTVNLCYVERLDLQQLHLIQLGNCCFIETEIFHRKELFCREILL